MTEKLLVMFIISDSSRAPAEQFSRCCKLLVGFKPSSEAEITEFDVVLQGLCPFKKVLTHELLRGENNDWECRGKLCLPLTGRWVGDIIEM